MAAGTFTFYTNYMEKAENGAINLEADTLCLALVTSGYVPDGLHSDYATQVQANEVSASVASGLKVLTNVNWTISGSSVVKLDCDDVVVTAADAMKAKYAVIYTQSALETICYVDLDTAVTTGVEATQITVTMPVGGLMKKQNG